MVEFAVAATALLLVLFGIVEFSRLLYTYHAVANAARIGSRWAIVRGTVSCGYATGQALKNDPNYGTCPADQTEIQKYVRSVVPMEDASVLTVTAAWSAPSSTGGCTTRTTDLHGAGCIVAVTVKNTFNFAVPFVSTTKNIVISSTSQEAISQ